jgi:hypothetical protein
MELIAILNRCGRSEVCHEHARFSAGKKSIEVSCDRTSEPESTTISSDDPPCRSADNEMDERFES